MIIKSRKVLSILLCLSLVTALFFAWNIPAGAETTQQKIDRLKKQNAEDEAILNALNERLGELDAQINENVSKINQLNAQIEENNNVIEQKKIGIENDKLAYRKRLRSIYMTNSDSRLQIILGAKSFSQYMQLDQLTTSVSAYDKKLITGLVNDMKELEAKNAENETLKADYEKKQKQLDSDREELAAKQAEAQSIFENSKALVEKAEAEKRAEEEAARQRAISGGTSGGASAPAFTGSSVFGWPSDYTYISAGFASNDSVHNGRHFGIDIAGGGIMGTPIYAIGDGYVTYMNNTCPHNYGKWGSCGCGGGYGNYAQIDHGTINGHRYTAIYGHATSIIVSPGQHVSKGQVIGYIGTTGFSTGPHLHFGLMQDGSWVNPLNYY